MVCRESYFGKGTALERERGPSSVWPLSLCLILESKRLNKGLVVGRQAQTIPTDCSMVVQIEAVTRVYVISSKTT